MVIRELPVGSVIRLGRYVLGHRPDEMINIDWIKVSKDNDFISQKVLLGIQFDVREGWNDNPDYSLSNIRQFMNSEQCSWFHPTHPDDVGPRHIILDNYKGINIGRYPGLLYHFSDREIGLLEMVDGDYLRLPTISNIMGGYPYFKRYGKRAHPTTEFGQLTYDSFSEGMFHRYYMIDDEGVNVAEMDRAGNVCSISPNRYSGVRPVCKIKGDIEISQTSKNTYEINLLSSEPVKFFKETQSVDWLLGL